MPEPEPEPVPESDSPPSSATRAGEEEAERLDEEERLRDQEQRIQRAAEQLYAEFEYDIGTYLSNLPTRSQREDLLRQFEFQLRSRKRITREVVLTAIAEAKRFCDAQDPVRYTVGPLVTAIGNVLNPKPLKPEHRRGDRKRESSSVTPKRSIGRNGHAFNERAQRGEERYFGPDPATPSEAVSGVRPADD